jgi:hypothetical protein
MENYISASEEGICVMEFNSELIHDRKEKNKEKKDRQKNLIEGGHWP